MDWTAKHRLAQAVGDIAYESELRKGDQRMASVRYQRAYQGMMEGLERIEQRIDGEMSIAEWLEAKVTA